MKIDSRRELLSWKLATWKIKQEIKRLRAKNVGSNNLKVWRRCKAILMFIDGESVIEIAETVEVVRSTVYGWIDMFEELGVDGLKTSSAPGAVSRLTDEQKKDLYTTIKEKIPNELGYGTGVWTAPLIGDLIFSRYGVKYHNNYIPTLLAELKLSRQKPRKQNPKADKKAQFRWLSWRFPAIKREAKKCNGVVLFEDEASFWVDSTLHYTWAPVGQQPIVNSYGQRNTAHIFGALSLENSSFTYRFEKKFNGQTFGKFLVQLVKKYAPRKVFLIIDNAPCHWLSDYYKQWYRNNSDKIRLFRLPAYSPELNPIEKAWKETRKRATHNRFHKTSDELNFELGKVFRKFQRDSSILKPYLNKWK